MSGESKRRDDDLYDDSYDDFELEWDEELNELNFDEEDSRLVHRDSKMGSDDRVESKKQHAKKKKRRKERRDKRDIKWDD
ncbi:MAG: hypothetical protein JW746_05105 [Candidatus Krumholzibacteriota bacterium]|nr:hypothetical protein [Candidatus Krumholzibacteriota bacterium]